MIIKNVKNIMHFHHLVHIMRIESNYVMGYVITKKVHNHAFQKSAARLQMNQNAVVLFLIYHL